MNRNKIKKLTAAIILSAGMLVVDMQPLFAQGQTGQSSTQNKNKQTDTSAGTDSTKSIGNNAMDDMFVKKVSETNLAEIELGKMALEKGASEAVRDYAEIMIEHHTAAQTELYSVVSTSPITQTDINKSDNPVLNRTDNFGNDANDETNIESTNNDADKTATLGGTGGTTGSSMAEGKTNGQYDSNLQGQDADSAGSDASSRQSTTAENSTRSSNAGTSSTTTAETNTAGTASGSASDAGNTANTASMKNGYLPSEISAEHKELMRKLSVLSGEEFDRLYIEAMVKDHAKAVELFEKQALHSKHAGLQSFASKMLPVVKEHYQMAQKLSGS